MSALTEPDCQKSRRKKGFWAQKLQPEIAKSLATFHRTLKSQCGIAFSCLGNLGSAMGIAIANHCHSLAAMVFRDSASIWQAAKLPSDHTSLNFWDAEKGSISKMFMLMLSFAIRKGPTLHITHLQENLEDPNLLKLRSLDSFCPFFLSDNSIWGQ